MGKALLVVIVFALVVYGVLRLLELRRARRAQGRSAVRPEPPLRRPLAPDDDPDFLREIEQRRRREQREREKRGDTDTPPPDPSQQPGGTGQDPHRDDEAG